MLGWSTQLGNKLFGQDPKLEFRKPGQGAELLAGSRTIPIDDPYWSQYLTLFDSPSDVLYLLPNSLLLRTLHTNPQNLLSLFSFTTSHLFRLLEERSISREGWIKEILNCVRVLTRLIPVLLGPQNGTTDRVEEELFWNKQTVRKEQKPKGSVDGKPGTQTEEEEEESGQFVLEDDDDEDDERDPLKSPSSSTSRSNATQGEEEVEYEELPCLAERMISTLIKLLFVPGLTLSSDLRSSDSIITYSIWEPGIASPFSSSTPLPSTPNSTLSARLEVLRLLTLLVSLPSLLTPPHLYTSVPNRFRESLITGQALQGQGQEGKNVILCLLCSLINTACQAGRSMSNYGESTNVGDEGGGLRASAARFAVEAARRTQDVALGSVGVGNGGINGSSASSLTGGGGGAEDIRSLLVGCCLQLLGVVLIDHASPSPPSTTKPTPTNLFEFYLSKLHRTEDFSFLLSGLQAHVYNALVPPSLLPLPISFSLPLPKNPLDPNSPNSPSESLTKSKPSGWTTEALTVLWRLVEKNKKFVQWLVRSKDQGGSGKWGELIGLLEVVRNEWRGDETQIGLVRLASFLIQTLTAETALFASNSPEHTISLKQTLNNPLSGSNKKLKDLIKRQCASSGIEAENLTLVEFLITSAHSLILSPSTNKSCRLSTLYPSIILSIDNLSPHIVELSNDASTRLVRIWLAFSAPSWVLMEEGNPRLIFYLLETFNNILYHNFSLSSRFIYALSQTHKRFELLSHFTLELGVSEARRLRAERRKRQLQYSSSNLESVKEGEATTNNNNDSSSRLSARSMSSPRLSISSTYSNTSGGPTSPTRTNSLTEGGGGDETELSEKAAGKRRERSLSSLGTFNMSELSLNEGSGTQASTVSEDEGTFVGKNGFVPTEQWVSSWREGLPLDPILILLSELLPQISDSPTRTLALDTILSSSSAILPLLPPSPTPPKPRKFLLSPPLQTWLASTLYGKIYLTHLDFLRDVVEVQLFAIQQAPNLRNGRRSGGLGLERTVEEVGRGVGEFARGVFGRVGGR
ncbi:hypothetical protein JCM3765_006112 [Sporobolomyces pararoseus]